MHELLQSPRTQSSRHIGHRHGWSCRGPLGNNNTDKKIILNFHLYQRHGFMTIIPQTLEYEQIFKTD